MSRTAVTNSYDECHWPDSVDRSTEQVDRFRLFFDRSGICVADLDHSGRIIEANVDLVRQFGRLSSDICQRRFCDLLHPSVREKIGNQFVRLADRQRSRFDDQLIAVRPDQSVFSAELTGIAVLGTTGRLDSIMVLLRPDKGDREDNVLATRKRLLSPMEARILEGVAAGVSTVQLASILYLSRGGVEYHVASLLRKLKVSNRPSLISKSYSMGIFQLGSWPPRVLPDFVK